jgi:hypothetical protein
VREQLDDVVRNVERVLLAQKDGTGVAKKPTLVEVQACVQCLRDAIASSEDGITALLLKACPKGIEWLHRVILAVWHVGQALVAWTRALVVPLYKGKGS